MKKISLILALSVLSFVVLAGALFYAFYPGDLSDPYVFSQYTRKKIEKKYPLTIKAGSLKGEEVVIIELKDRPALMDVDDLLVHLDRNLLFVTAALERDYRTLANLAFIPFKIQDTEDAEWLQGGPYDNRSCYGFDGGRVTVKDEFEGNLLVRYTPSAKYEINPALALTVPECSSRSVLSMSIENYQMLQREHFLREHYDPVITRLEWQATQKRERALRERERALREKVEQARQ